MKKKIAIICALALGSCLILPACADNTAESGYRQPTDEELEQVLTSIESGDLFGNGEGSDVTAGLSAEGSFELSTGVTGMIITVSGEFDYDLMVTASSVAGAGSMTMTADTTASVDIYNDESYIYLKALSGGQQSGAKIAIADILSSMGGTGGYITAVSEQSTPQFSVEYYKQMGIDIGIDTSDGTKLKFSANDDYFAALESQLGGGSITDSVLEMYLNIDSQGVFEQLSVTIDIGAEMTYNGVTQTMDMAGQFVVNNSDEEVVLPEEIYDETLYPLIDMQPDLPEETPGEQPGNAPQSTADGVVTAMSYGEAGDDLLYDNATDSVIAVGKKSYKVYNAESGELLSEETMSTGIECADVWNGKLCLGLGEAKQIKVINLENGIDTTFTTDITVCDIAVMDDCIVFCDGDQWCEVKSCDFDGQNMTTLIISVHEPLLTPNRDDNYVYVVERNLSSISFYYINLNDGSYINHADFSQYAYNTEPAKYDGQYVHFDGKTFDKLTGEQITSVEIAEPYPAGPEEPKETIYVGERYSLVRSAYNNMLIYDREADQFVYTADLYPVTAYERPDGTLLVTCHAPRYAAIIDLSSL